MPLAVIATQCEWLSCLMKHYPALHAFLFTASLAVGTIVIGKWVADYQQLEYSKQFGPVQVYTLPKTPATGEYTSY